MPEHSYVKKMFAEGNCTHCNDVAIAVHLMNSSDNEKRKIGLDIFYNALCVVFSHEYLTTKEILTEVIQAEKAVEKLLS